MIACLVIGFAIGMWLGYRIGAKLAIFNLGRDIWNKLK